MASDCNSGGIRIRWLPLLMGLIAAADFIVGGLQMGPFGRYQVVHPLA